MNDGHDGTPRADWINDLDCIVCGRWFRNFDRLAAHMHARHGRPTPNQPGDVELPPATRTRPAFVPVQRGYMAKTKTKATKRTTKRRSGVLPAPETTKGDTASDFNPFLKADDIGDVGDSAKLLLTGENRLGEGQFGEQIIVEVKHGRNVFDFGIGLDRPNYRLLFERFGNNIKKWRGPVNVTIKQGQNAPYIAVMRERTK